MNGGIKARAPLNPRDQDRLNSQKASTRHDSEVQRTSYGIINKISTNNQVQIRLLNNDAVPGELINNGKYMPLLNDISDIVFRWGQLRKEMLVRISWTGESVLQPRRVLCEVIAEDAKTLLKPEDRSNELKSGPWKIFISGF